MNILPKGKRDYSIFFFSSLFNFFLHCASVCKLIWYGHLRLDKTLSLLIKNIKENYGILRPVRLLISFIQLVSIVVAELKIIAFFYL